MEQARKYISSTSDFASFQLNGFCMIPFLGQLPDGLLRELYGEKTPPPKKGKKN